MSRQTDVRKAHDLLAATFHEIGDVPIRQALVFLTVAQMEQSGREITVMSVAESLDSHSSAISRHMAALGEYHWNKKKPGLKLIEFTQDPKGDLRVKSYRLTAKGRRVLKKILEANR